MPERVRITDVSPRDGLQNEPGVVPARDKARLVELLALAGVDEVEVTSLVSPRWVPALGDAEEVLRLVRERWGGAGVRRPVFSVLVPNDKGFERLLALRDAADFPLKVAVFTAASETFARRNTNASIAETVERFRAFLPRAAAEGMAVRLYVSCAVACPFEGRVAPAAVRRVADMLLEAAPGGELDVADTIGVATPEDIAGLLGVFTPAERAAMTLHLHDTFGRAAACVRSALGLGVRSFDGAAGGLGGCPYAGTPERRAPGNIDTAALVRTVESAGFTTGIDAAGLAEASAFAARVVAEARAAAAQGSPA